jgi:hypothetical protein
VIKLGFGRNEARDKTSPGELATGYLTGSVGALDDRTGLTRRPSLTQPEFGPPTPPLNQVTRPGARMSGRRTERPRGKNAIVNLSTHLAILRLIEARAAQDLADGRPALAWTGPHAGGGPTRLTGQTCTVIRTDVVEFGANRRNAEAHKIIRNALPAMTRLALGSAWDTCRCADRGDGLLVIVPPECPTAQVIERLVISLPLQLKRHNLRYSAASRIQLRLAIAVGPIEDTESGVSGRSIVDVSRILETPAFKQAVAGQGAILGVILAPFVYETYIKPGGSFLDATDFTEVPVQVKEVQGSAWMQLIGAVPSPRQPLIPAPAGHTPQDGQVQLATSGASSPCSRV